MVEDANELSGALGQAARESDTWTNVTGNLKQAWTDLQAKLGAPILGVVTKGVSWLATKVSTLTEKISSGGNPVQTFIDKLGSLKDWMLEIGTYAADKLEPIFTDVEAVFTKVKDAIEPLVEKVVEYVTSGQAASDITTVVKGAVDLLASAYESVKGFIEGVVTGFENAVTWGKEHENSLILIGIALGTLTAAIAAYNIAMAIKNAGGIVELAQLAATAIGVGALTVAQTAQTVATTIGTAAMSAFGAVMSFVTSPITLVVLAIGALIAVGVLLYKNWDVIKEKCAELWSSVSAWFAKIRDSAVEKFNDLKAKVVNAASNAWDGVKNAFSNMKTSVVNFVTGLWQQATQKFDDMKTKLSNAASNAWSGVKTAFSNMKTSVVNFVSNIWSSVTQKFSDMKDKAVEKATSIWTNVKTAFTGLKNSVSSIFSGIKDSIVDKIENAKNTVKGIVDKIVGFFTGAKFSWPSIPTPHFGITPKGWKVGDLLKGSIPKLSIDWYAKAMQNAMILDKPTIFGYNAATGELMGGGENGSEVVSGTGTLMQMIASAVESRTGAQTQAIVSALSVLTDAILGSNGEMLEALRAGQQIVLNGREVARTVREYA